MFIKYVYELGFTRGLWLMVIKLMYNWAILNSNERKEGNIEKPFMFSRIFTTH